MSLFVLVRDTPGTDVSVEMEHFVSKITSRLTGCECERATRYIRPIHRFDQCTSFAMQRYAITNYMITNGIPFTKGLPTINRPPKEKPFCSNYPDIHFNASHSGGCVAVYVDSRPCGVDVEYRDADDESRHSDILYDLVGKKHRISRDMLPATTGIRLWTQIEAWLKLSGCGLKGVYDMTVSHDPTTGEFALRRHDQTMPCHKDITYDLPENVYGTLVLEDGVMPTYTMSNVSLNDLLI